MYFSGIWTYRTFISLRLPRLVGWFEVWLEKLYVHRNVYFELLNEICNLRTILIKRPMGISIAYLKENICYCMKFKVHACC
jgi:hypothetical protein